LYYALLVNPAFLTGKYPTQRQEVRGRSLLYSLIHLINIWCDLTW